jgi:hypothetical protein
LKQALQQLLHELEQDLAKLVHKPELLERIRTFSHTIGNRTAERQPILNLPGVLWQNPILLETALTKGYAATADAFNVLQGDVIATQSAYFMGERQTGNRYFIVLTPTCDLVFERRQYASLLELQPIMASHPDAKALLGSLTAFKRTDAMYLPPLLEDLTNQTGVLGYAVSFDGICSISNAEVQLAQRIRSLSLVGWRVFCAMIQGVLTRTGEDEQKLRESFSV